MKSYDVWMEGYRITGAYAFAHYVGSTTANSFKEACVKLLNTDTSFNEERLSVWGCKLFDNETDARAGFG